jgi:hypothetical protein
MSALWIVLRDARFAGPQDEGLAFALVELHHSPTNEGDCGMR